MRIRTGLKTQAGPSPLRRLQRARREGRPARDACPVHVHIRSACHPDQRRAAGRPVIAAAGPIAQHRAIGGELDPGIALTGRCRWIDHCAAPISVRRKAAAAGAPRMDIAFAIAAILKPEVIGQPGTIAIVGRAAVRCDRRVVVEIILLGRHPVEDVAGDAAIDMAVM